MGIGLIRQRFARFTARLRRDRGTALTRRDSVLDVSAAAHARQAISSTEARYHTLFERIDEGFCVVEVLFDEHGVPVDFQYLDVNPAFEAHTGLVAIAGRTALECTPTLESWWVEVYGGVALSGKPARFTHDSKVLQRSFDLYAFRFDDGAQRRVAVLVNDITARKRTEALLKEARRRQAYLLRLSDATRSLSNPSDIQSEAARLIGEFLDADWSCYVEFDEEMTRATVRHHHVRNGAPPLPARHSCEGFPGCVDALKEGRTVVVEDLMTSPLVTEAGREHYRRLGVRGVTISPVLEQGVVIASLTVLNRKPRSWTPTELAMIESTADRTWAAVERAHAEENLRRSEARLQASLEALREREERLKDDDRRKDEFLAVLAHELRNPLAPIRTGLELIRLAGNAPEAVGRVRAMMERQTTHMVRLIDDLLDVSRVTSGKIQLQRQPTPLGTLVNVAVEANRAALAEKSISLTVDLPAESMVLDVDPTRFVQVLSNLLHNAVKFTPAAGTIRVAARLTREREISLTVTDSGVGMTPEVLPRVFDMFTQGDLGAPSSHGGLGIGLALARRLVEMHGGSIEASSDGLGRGSTFTLRLPVVTSSPPRPSSRPTPSSGELKRRVVVIDDNTDSADMMGMLVSALGGEPLVAYDGKGGLQRVLEFRPDIVLLDIGMPGLDGYETCREIRRRLGPTVTVIAMTGWGQQQDKEDAHSAGFDAHLTKPVDPMMLQKMLANVGD